VIIDFHVHCFPDKLAPRAVSQLAANAGIPPRVDGTINGLKESMKRAGISKSSRHIAFGSIHPDYENWKAELFRIKNMGLKGIK